MPGRVGLYEDWITEDGLIAIEGWARDGLTDKQIAEEKIGVAERTFTEWKSRFPAISAALKKGKAPVDTKVENALLRRALGYEYEETTVELVEQADGSTRKIIRKVTKTVIPDTTAQIVWLCNRRPDKWKRNPNNVSITEIEDLTPLAELLKDDSEK